jgi:cytochrome c oxidase subunit II
MSDSPYGYWLPKDISTHGHQVDLLIDVLHWFMAVLFIGWGIFFTYCLVRFRARPDRQASYQQPKAKASKYAEVCVALFEVAILVFISIPAWSEAKAEIPTAEDNPFEVRVVAEQFAWNFHYPGVDGVFGRTAPELMGAENLIGLDRSGVGADDVVTNNDFRVPVNRTVLIRLSSKDVIHSFWIPVLRVKQDAIPGMVIPVWFEATETGDFHVACAQLCGNNHYNMKGDFSVLNEDDLSEWLAYMAPGDDEEEEEEEDD